MTKNAGSLLMPLKKISHHESKDDDDFIAVEEPLEIRLTYWDDAGEEMNHTIAVTMRTPGHDIDLALGFLYTEGIIKYPNEIIDIIPCGPILNQAQSQNIIRVKIHRDVKVDLEPLKRNNFVNSSCGICGKTSIEALKAKFPAIDRREGPHCSSEVIMQLPALLRQQQSLFEQTGGLHASALFTSLGELIALREDVGRHNALDKLIGYAFRAQILPLHDTLLLVSGRVSFELVQKASMAGIRFMAAVGAPSSLALQLAHERAMTVVGFVRDRRFNIYCGSQRIQ